MELENMSVGELKSVIRESEKIIERKKNRDLNEFLAKFREEARNKGYSWNDVVRSIRSGKKGQPVAPKYRDQYGNHWSGRGRKPRWIVAHERAGGSLEDFRIE